MACSKCHDRKLVRVPFLEAPAIPCPFCTITTDPPDLTDEAISEPPWAFSDDEAPTGKLPTINDRPTPVVEPELPREAVPPRYERELARLPTLPIPAELRRHKT